MIAKALDFVTVQLDSYLKRKTSTSESKVKLSSVASTAENTLVVSLVNITEEGIIANQTNIGRQGNSLLKQAPPVHLNLYILISAAFKENNYKEGLSWLSSAINFFQENPYFISSQIQMPKGIDKLSFELVNLDIDNMSQFWGALGSNYQPSVIYKMRMLKISDDSIEAVLPEITETETKTNPS